MEGERFELSNPEGTDLQSVAFSHFATPPFKWWLGTESNRRHKDFQSFALPTELPSLIMAGWTGLEPATSCVTGRHSNQLNYQTIIYILSFFIGFVEYFGCGGRI